MDENRLFISPHDRYASVGSGAEPIVVDVRHDSDFTNLDRLPSSALRRSSKGVEQWRDELPDGCQVVTWCFHGDSQGIATTLRVMGVTEPQCDGHLAISRGLSANFPYDHETLRPGLVIYHALYKWCRLEAEKQEPTSAPPAGVRS